VAYGSMTNIFKPQARGMLSRLFERLTGRNEAAAITTPPRSDTNQLTVAAEVRASAHKDGLVLLHIPSGRVFLCNRTGARVWQGLARGLNVDAIADEISREYGVTRDLVQQHTSSFVTDLEQHGFVSRWAAW